MALTPVLNMPPILKFLLPHPIFVSSPPLRHFIQSSLHAYPSRVNPSSSNTPTPCTSSHLRYLFPATNHSYLKSDEPTQTNVVKRVGILGTLY